MKCVWSRWRRKQGAALIMVLAVIVMIAALAILFLTVGNEERTTAYIALDGTEARLLADTAVQAVIGQIRLATVGEDDAGGKRFWASQPGAIRTWTADGSGGKLFKLYSSSASTAAIPNGDARLSMMQKDAALMAQWRADGSRSDRFVDMNEPILKRDPSGAVTEMRFPIADPRALVLDGVEGFSVGTGAPEGTRLTGDETSRLPMPVEWIYLLRDGSMGTLDPAGKFIGNPMPTAENPITGRIAFWTDDESCKVNLNTASEGQPWDTPRCVTKRDLDYALHPPQFNEVQRWQGHPATVCLSSIFFPGGRLDASADGDKLTALYDLVPRVNYAADGGEIAFDDSPLLVQVSDALRDGHGNLRPLFSLPGQSAERLDRAGFFLTTQSRAPELTLNGQPRVALWPVNENHGAASSRVTAFDRLVNFTCTLNGTAGQEYHVQRQKPESQVDEYHLTPPLLRNSQLASYLDRQLHEPMPKFGLSFADKYPVNDLRFNVYRFLDGIRSTNLHDLTRLTADRRVTSYQDAQIPGVVSGVAFSELAGKAGVPTWVKDLENYRVPGRDFTISEVALMFICIAHHRTDGTQTGDPSFFSATSDARLSPGEMAVQPALFFELFCTGQGYVMILPHLRLEMESESLVKMRVNGQPSLHQGHSHPDHTLGELWGAPPFTYGNTKPKGPSRGDGTRRPDNWVGWGGSGGFHILTSPINVKDKVERLKPSKERTGYFMKEYFKVRDDEPMMITTETADQAITLDLTVQRTWVTSWDARQRLRVKFPLPIQCPVPQIDPDKPLLWSWEQRMENRGYKVLTERYQTDNPYDALILPGDTVRSMVVAHGDYRLPDVWGRKEGRFNDETTTPAETYFAPHPGWQDVERRQAHSLTPSGGAMTFYPQTDVSASGYTKSTVYQDAVRPDLPISPEPPSKGEDLFARGVPAPLLKAYGRTQIDPRITRDWSNGTGIAPDGAYISRADDGSISGDSSDSPPPYFGKAWEDMAKAAQGTQQGHAPNRLVSSAGIFGSMPSMPVSNVPWNTYLFRPDISGGHLGSKWNRHDEKRNLTGNPHTLRPSGALAPPDHLLMDLFWMPVVSPYAISERFSTAGKINLNHQMLPFTWIKRTTALHAALKSEEILAIPSDAGAQYKDPALIASAEDKWRHPVDAGLTLKQLEPVFDAGDAFVSPTEICEYFLVPKGQDIAGGDATQITEQMQTYWKDHALTGDNVLEQPYTNLVAKLTTKSNIYLVHFRAQTIKKAVSADPETFDPTRDSIRADYRGSALIERWLPPQPSIPHSDPATASEAQSLESRYRFRVLNHQRFSW